MVQVYDINQGNSFTVTGNVYVGAYSATVFASQTMRASMVVPAFHGFGSPMELQTPAMRFTCVQQLCD